MTKYLSGLLECGITPYQAVAYTKEFLREKGFAELDFKKPFSIKEGGRYYVTPYPSALFMFAAGTGLSEKTRVKIAVAHTDFPCFKVKCNPEYLTKGYCQLNVEPYGGMLKSTWFDRPLGVAGKVALRTEDIYAPKTALFDSGEAVLVIPSLAPHMDGKSGQKQEYDMQRELQPVYGMGSADFTEYIAKKLSVDREDLLSFDLFLYNRDKPERIGAGGEFICSPRIDNLASVAALTEAIEGAMPDGEIALCACFDHEEVGSRSKQGADSALLPILLQKIEEGLLAGGSVQSGWSMREALLNGFLLSVDGAHAVHPNYTDKSDPTNEVVLGGGIAVKTSASQRYISDGEGLAVIKQLCQRDGVSYQTQVNRSGMPGGQTLGPIVSSYLPVQGADIGLPMLGMHSARETAACRDYAQLVKFLKGS